MYVCIYAGGDANLEPARASAAADPGTTRDRDETEGGKSESPREEDTNNGECKTPVRKGGYGIYDDIVLLASCDVYHISLLYIHTYLPKQADRQVGYYSSECTVYDINKRASRTIYMYIYVMFVVYVCIYVCVQAVVLLLLWSQPVLVLVKPSLGPMSFPLQMC